MQVTNYITMLFLATSQSTQNSTSSGGWKLKPFLGQESRYLSRGTQKLSFSYLPNPSRKARRLTTETIESIRINAKRFDDIKVSDITLDGMKGVVQSTVRKRPIGILGKYETTVLLIGSSACLTVSLTGTSEAEADEQAMREILKEWPLWKRLYDKKVDTKRTWP